MFNQGYFDNFVEKKSKEKFDFGIGDSTGKGVIHYIAGDAYLGLISYLCYHEGASFDMIDDCFRTPDFFIANEFLISSKILKKLYHQRISPRLSNSQSSNKSTKFLRMQRLTKMLDIEKNGAISMSDKITMYSKTNLEFNKSSFATISMNNINRGIKFSKHSFNSNSMKLSTRLKGYKFSNRIIPSLSKINAMRGTYILLEREIEKLTLFKIEKDPKLVKTEWKPIFRRIHGLLLSLYMTKDRGSAQNCESELNFKLVYSQKFNDLMEQLFDFLIFNSTIFHFKVYVKLLSSLTSMGVCQDLVKYHWSKIADQKKNIFYGFEFGNKFKTKFKNKSSFFFTKKGKKNGNFLGFLALL